MCVIHLNNRGVELRYLGSLDLDIIQVAEQLISQVLNQGQTSLTIQEFEGRSHNVCDTCYRSTRISLELLSCTPVMHLESKC